VAVKRGQFTIPSSQSTTGRGFYASGTKVNVGGEHFQLTWNGPAVYGLMLEVIMEVMQTLENSGLAHIQDIVPVDTGYLRSTCYVTIEVQSNRIILRIGAEAEYAIYVELGTSRTEAQPFIRPTADWVADQIMDMLQAAAEARGF
jgi:HK97 gp10 family phage protein